MHTAFCPERRAGARGQYPEAIPTCTLGLSPPVAWHPVGDRVMLRDMAARSPEKRKADALLKLEAVKSNVWVATASPIGGVHLVPVTHTWNRIQVVLATGPSSRTVSNLTTNPTARLALGET
jgi:hypothetical protein